MTPADFQLRTRFGVGSDWPISYDDLEPYYCQAEELMQVAGPAQHAICPRSRPCPQEPHEFSQPDRLLQRAYPGEFFALPSARPRRPTTGGRAACCGNGVCHSCPVDAKFTVQNEMSGVYRDQRVTLRLGARVDRVETRAGIATGVEFHAGGKDALVRGELIVLGANGIFNPHILLRSGFTDPQLGRGLTEQLGVYAVAWLDGVDNFGGSTSRCGHGYMLHRDATRRERAAGLVLTHNTMDVTGVRPRRGRWRQLLGLSIVYEDLRLPDNRITVDPVNPTRPLVTHPQRSRYTDAALEALPADLERMLAPLPVEGFSILKVKPTEAHIIGATVMGTDPRESVLDPDLRHHTVRNLVVLGSGAFPTAAPANPTLTLAALALRSADRILPPVRGAAA
jgi:choline dehydrogenase-like flavoprotein